jgi:glycosyltransferase involved in cell wall biosynthesis
MTKNSENDFAPLVTIVIPVYNGENYMREAIDSALAQTYKNIEIIVVNDGSIDSTEEIALSYGDKIQYFAKRNGGVATAVNLAIENMRGEYFSWLSHDDVYLPNKIERQIQELASLDNKNTIICSNYFICDANLDVLEKSLLEYREASVLINYPIFATLMWYISFGTLMISRQVLQEAGNFNSKLICVQDYDFYFRRLLKYPLKFVHDTLICCRDHQSRNSNNSSLLLLKEAANLWREILEGVTEDDLINIGMSKFGLFSYVKDQFGDRSYKYVKKYINNYIMENANTAIDISNIRVSIIISFRDKINCTLEAINSVTAQTHHNWEIILVNDHSTKDISSIKNICDGVKMKIFDNLYEKGMNTAMNFGMDSASGDYVAFLNANDLFMPEKIEKQLKYMILHGVDFCYTQYKTFSENRGNGMLDIVPYSRNNDRTLRKCTTAAISTIMLSKKIFSNQSYRFDPKIDAAADVCLWMKILQNFVMLLCPKTLTKVRITENSASAIEYKQITKRSQISSYLFNELKLLTNLECYIPFLFLTKKNKLPLWYRYLARPILRMLRTKQIVRYKYDRKWKMS